MAKQDVKTMLKALPNTVNGDGRNFVAVLKRILSEAKFASDGGGQEGGGGENNKGLEQVTGLRLKETNVEYENGQVFNNIEVNFDYSKVTNFKEAQIWKKVGSQPYVLVATSKSSPYTINDVVSGVTYTIKVVSVDTASNTSVFAEAPEASITIQGIPIVPSKPSQLTLVWDKDGPLWQWQDKRGPYDDYYELRLDRNAGVMDDMWLDRTYDMQSRANPNVRNGTAYLFKRNVFGEYGEPAVHQFNKQAGNKPNPPVLTGTLNGVQIHMDALPRSMLGYKIAVYNIPFGSSSLKKEVYTTPNNDFVYFQFTGMMAVKYCFYDEIGESEQSEATKIDVAKQIDGTQIANGAVGTNQIATNAVKAGQIDANAITADKIKAGAVETDKLAVGAVKADKIDANAVTSDKINANAVIADKIASGAITADKVSAGAITTPALNVGAVTADKIAVNAVTADKIDVTELSAITATIGTLRTTTSGARTEIKDNLIEVYDNNNRLRVRLGVW